jgi:xylulokinase
MNVLAIDVGTSSVKAAVVAVESAQPVGPICRAGYTLDHPQPDAAVLCPDRLWQAAGQAARQASAGLEVAGVGLSCLAPAWLLLDRHDQPLTPIVTHLDRRARPLARRLWHDCGPEFLRTAGNKPLPGGLSGIACAWILQQQPQLRQQTRRLLHLNGWLGLRLSGEAAFDPGNASFTGLFETLGRQTWSERLCQLLDLDLRWLGPVLPGDSTLSPLRPEAAEHLGLPRGIPVKLGLPDTSSAMLAAGMRPGELLHVVGTTQVLAAFAPAPAPAENHLTRLFGVGEVFIHVTHNPVGGVALDWLYHLCFRDQSAEEYYSRTLPGVLERATPVVLDPPFLGGDRLQLDPSSAALRFLSLSTDRLDVAAAILQAMQRHHEQARLALGLGPHFDRVYLTGGGAEIVEQIIPEYRQRKPVRLREGSLCGVARLFDRR